MENEEWESEWGGMGNGGWGTEFSEWGMGYGVWGKNNFDALATIHIKLPKNSELLQTAL